MIIDMDILNLIRISVKALLRNKTRTALSMLGIVIGIAAVIAVAPASKVNPEEVNPCLKSERFTP